MYLTTILLMLSLVNIYNILLICLVVARKKWAHLVYPLLLAVLHYILSFLMLLLVLLIIGVLHTVTLLKKSIISDFSTVSGYTEVLL